MLAHKLTVIASLALLICLAVACGQKPSTPAASGASSSATQVFTVKGVLNKIEPEGKKAIIQHEAIPNYMMAMTMPFNVKNADELKSLQPGDALTFRLTVTEDRSWIDQIQKTGMVQANEPPTRQAVRLVRDVEPLKVGDNVPDYRFTNELGQAISLSDFRGKALALTFIFTRCPMPDFCPLMSRKFAAAYKLLTADAAAPTNWHLLSLSFDPHFDTPDVLKRYARQYQYDPKKWSFATGAMIDIDAITEQFMVLVTKQEESWDHKLRTAVIDSEGRVQKIFVYNQWTPEELAAEIVKAAAVNKSEKNLPAPAAQK
jgi:protein SCO1